MVEVKHTGYDCYENETYTIFVNGVAVHVGLSNWELERLVEQESNKMEVD